MANRKQWSALADSYRHRLESKGITEQAYTSGASVKAARGHATTPERPTQAFRSPDLYSNYLRRRVAKGKHVPEGILPKHRTGGSRRTGDEDSNTPDIGDEIGWAGRDTLDIVTFYRSAGGVQRGDSGVMTVTSFHPDGSVLYVKQFPYDQSEFYDLIALAKARGFATNVTSIPQRDMSVIA